MEDYKLYNCEYYAHCKETRNAISGYMGITKYFPKETEIILDLGCGNGEGLLSIINKAYKIIGADFSKVAIDLAIKKRNELQIPKEKIEFHCFDIVKDLEIYGKFDIILMMDVIEHIEKERMELVAGKLCEHLNENGIVIITTPIYIDKKEILDRIETAKREKDKDRHEFFIYNMHINLQTKESILELFAGYEVEFPERNTVLVRCR